jgi:hypothetical protein
MVIASTALIMKSVLLRSAADTDGNAVHFEFIGVLELLRLDPACETDEVWYDITNRLRPMERRATIIPPESKLSAIRNHE